jgi:hypothetical protein
VERSEKMGVGCKRKREPVRVCVCFLRVGGIGCKWERKRKR